MNRGDVALILIAVALLVFVFPVPEFSIALDCAQLTQSPKVVFHTGVLEFANESTLIFQDGNIYANGMQSPPDAPIFVNDTSTPPINNSTYHWNWSWDLHTVFVEGSGWVRNQTLLKGHTYELYAHQVRYLGIWPFATTDSFLREVS
jgi:hypothetical protein